MKNEVVSIEAIGGVGMFLAARARKGKKRVRSWRCMAADNGLVCAWFGANLN